MKNAVFAIGDCYVQEIESRLKACESNAMLLKNQKYRAQHAIRSAVLRYARILERDVEKFDVSNYNGDISIRSKSRPGLTIKIYRESSKLPEFAKIDEISAMQAANCDECKLLRDLLNTGWIASFTKYISTRFGKDGINEQNVKKSIEHFIDLRRPHVCAK